MIQPVLQIQQKRLPSGYSNLPLPIPPNRVFHPNFVHYSLPCLTRMLCGPLAIRSLSLLALVSLSAASTTWPDAYRVRRQYGPGYGPAGTSSSAASSSTTPTPTPTSTSTSSAQGSSSSSSSSQNSTTTTFTGDTQCGAVSRSKSPSCPICHSSFTF